MDKSDNSNFSNNLRTAIGKESVSSFAKRCGLSEGLLRKYLSGSVPGLDKVIAISDAAGVSIDWLARGSDMGNHNIRGVIDTGLFREVASKIAEAIKDIPGAENISITHAAVVYNQAVSSLASVNDVDKAVLDSVNFYVDLVRTLGIKEPGINLTAILDEAEQSTLNNAHVDVLKERIITLITAGRLSVANA
ncbi:MAG: helix-turn-helix transcriptional regulator, partial [Candidatus Thiodiazotropha endolucinida]